jgi:DIM1 family U5 snRNP protein
MYELYDPMTLMFFFRNKHMMCDFGTGNNNKLNWVLEDKQELIDIIETIYRGAKKGRGLVVSPKGEWYSFACVWLRRGLCGDGRVERVKS